MSYVGNAPAVAYTNTVKDTFSGDNSTVAFTLSVPSTTNNVRVVVENVIQDPTVAYSVSGTTLTFTSAPPSGTNNIYVVHLGPAVQTVQPPTQLSGNFTLTGDLAQTGDYTLTGTANATAYKKAGVNGKLLVKTQVNGDGTNYTTTGFTNVVLSDTVTFVPASANSEVWVTISAAVEVQQTGGDDDAIGLIYAYTFQSDGTTRVAEIGTGDSILDREFGYANSEPDSTSKHIVPLQGSCTRASDGNIYVRLWGSLETDNTAGYAATLTMQHLNIIFKEYL